MNNPRIVATISGFVALVLAASILSPAKEAWSPGLTAMNWVFLFLAVFACVGSIVRLVKSRKA